MTTKFDLTDKEESPIEKFRRLHPKATKDLSDEEVIKLGNAITQIHEDNTPRVFKDVFTNEQGESFVIVSDGKKDVAIKLLESRKEKKNG